ncbi:MAG: hypothetical protein ACI8Y6_002653, partial [Brevundimonas sp.]
LRRFQMKGLVPAVGGAEFETDRQKAGLERMLKRLVILDDQYSHGDAKERIMSGTIAGNPPR